MKRHDFLPRSISGHLLEGGNAVKFVFMDEAGTSGAQRENARVVAAVVVDADRQLLRAEALLDEAITSVPEQFRENFVLHSEEIMNSRQYKDEWRLTDRVNFLAAVMGIPRRLGLGLAFGHVWASMPPTDLASLIPPGRKQPLKRFEEQTLFATMYCISRADKIIREDGELDEIGTIVAEQSDLQAAIVMLPSLLRESPMVFTNEHLRNRQIDDVQGYNSQDGVVKVTRLRRTIHFVGKDEDRLVWLADACAYGIKRFFNRHDFGDVFCRSIYGKELIQPDFDGPMSSSSVNFGKPRSERPF